MGAADNGVFVRCGREALTGPWHSHQRPMESTGKDLCKQRGRCSRPAAGGCGGLWGAVGASEVCGRLRGSGTGLQAEAVTRSHFPWTLTTAVTSDERKDTGTSPAHTAQGSPRSLRPLCSHGGGWGVGEGGREVLSSGGGRTGREIGGALGASHGDPTRQPLWGRAARALFSATRSRAERWVWGRSCARPPPALTGRW